MMRRRALVVYVLVGSCGVAAVIAATSLASTRKDGAPVASTSRSEATSSPARSPQPQDREALQALEHALQARVGALSYGPALYDDITDLLPNVRYKLPDGERALTDAFAFGKIVAVQPGAGFHVVNEDTGEALPVDFSDPRARWKTIHLTVQVLEEIGPGEPLGKEITVGLAVNGSAELATFRDGFLAMGRAIFPLITSPVFAYDESLHAIARDGGLLMTVNDGTLALPFLTNDEERPLLSKANTLDELRRAAEQPVSVHAG